MGLRSRAAGLAVAAAALALTLAALLYWPPGAVGGAASGLLALRDRRLALIVQALTAASMAVALLGVPRLVGLLGPISPVPPLGR